MITASRGTALWAICDQVARMKPGWFLEIDWRELAEIPGFDHNGAAFTPADRVLENIVGSSTTHSYSTRPNGNVVFERHHDTGEVCYRSPDQRGLTIVARASSLPAQSPQSE